MFIDTIQSSSEISTLHTPDFGWKNYRYASDIFRLAHVERYSDDKIEVLHITTFPHRWSPEPIFGFDVIATKDTVIGAYMDLSPVVNIHSFDDSFGFKERKPIPEWATVFSDQFICLKPIDHVEFQIFSMWAYQKYMWYLDLLRKKQMGDVDIITERQNHYCDVQSKNPRTYNVLKAKIGEEKAKYFMEEILFPKLPIYKKGSV